LLLLIGWGSLSSSYSPPAGGGSPLYVPFTLVGRCSQFAFVGRCSQFTLVGGCSQSVDRFETSYKYWRW
jgi:hypothetical protein